MDIERVVTTEFDIQRSAITLAEPMPLSSIFLCLAAAGENHREIVPRWILVMHNFLQFDMLQGLLFSHSILSFMFVSKIMPQYPMIS